MVAETKIDATFPTGQFVIEGFATPFRLDRNANGGGLLVYVRSDIPSRQLNSFKFSEGVECISFEINLRERNGHYLVFIDHQLNLRIIYLKILIVHSITTAETMRILCL